MLDVLRERKPRFVPAAVIAEFAPLLRSYNIGECPSSNALGQTAAFGTEALARLGLRLGSFQPMLQSSQFDGVAFDPFSLQKDGLASAEVDVGRR